MMMTRLRVMIAGLSLATGVPSTAGAADALDENLSKVHRCSDALVLCIYSSGELVPEETVPTEISVDERLSIAIFGCKADSVDLSVDFRVRRNMHRLFREVLKGDDEGRKSFAACPKEHLRTFQSDPIPSDGRSLVAIVETKTSADAKAPNHRKRFIVPVKVGRYFLDVGLLTAFTINGSRRVRGVAAAGTSNQEVVVREDVAINPVLVLNIYPFGGRRVGSVFFCEDPEGCRSGDFFGLQFGLDMDLSDPLDQWYFGIVLEPITGVSLSLGGALRKGEFLGAAEIEGRVLPRDTEPNRRTAFMLRPYFGLTLTYDALNTLSAARTKILGLQPK